MTYSDEVSTGCQPCYGLEWGGRDLNKKNLLICCGPARRAGCAIISCKIQTIQEPSVLEEKTKKAREMLIYGQDLQLLKISLKRTMILPGKQRSVLQLL